MQGKDLPKIEWDNIFLIIFFFIIKFLGLNIIIIIILFFLT